MTRFRDTKLYDLLAEILPPELDRVFLCNSGTEAVEAALKFARMATKRQRVVAAMEDPNPVNSGRGFERLRAAGIEVESGICEEEARRLNEAFASWVRRGRPLVTLKTAATLDGQLSLTGNGRARNPAPSRRGGGQWWSMAAR